MGFQNLAKMIKIRCLSALLISTAHHYMVLVSSEIKIVVWENNY